MFDMTDNEKKSILNGDEKSLDKFLARTRKKYNEMLEVKNKIIKDKLTDVFSRWEEIVFENQEEFFSFVEIEAWQLLEVSWCEDSMKFVYCLHSGQHICESIPFIKWMDFVDNCLGIK